MSGDEKDNIELNNKEGGGIEMTVKIYSPEKHYDWENEVKQCDRIWSKLYEEFEEKDGEYSLFFDLKICGRQFDMVFVTEDKVVIIEMKDKNGEITLTRNLSKIKYDDGTTEEKRLFSQCCKQREELFFKLLLNKYFNKKEKFDEDLDLPRYIRVILVFPNDADYKEVKGEYPPYFRYLKEDGVVPQINSFRRGKGYPELDVKKIADLIKKAAYDVSKWDEEKIRRRLKFIKENFKDYGKEQQSSQSRRAEVDKKKKYQQISKDLKSKEIDRVEKAIETVKYLDLNSHFKEIQELLESSNPEKRIISLESLSEIDADRDREEILQRFVDDEEVKVRKKADELMKFFGTPDSLKKYLNIIENSEDYSRVMDAVEVIGNIGDKTAVSQLLRLYEDIEERFGNIIKFWAAKELGMEKKTEDHMKSRYYSLLNEDRDKILNTIIEVGDDKSVSQLIDLYRNYEEKFKEELEEVSKVRRRIYESQSNSYEKILRRIKWDILKAIKEIDPPSVVPFAEDYLNPYDTYHEGAIELLGSSKNKDALKLLEKIIKSSEFSRDARIKAIEALGELGFEEGAEIIHDTLEQQSNFFAEEKVKNSLTKIGSQKTFDFLMNESKFDPFPDHLDKTNLDRVDRLSKIYYMLIKLNTDRFENEIFKILDSGNLKEKENLLRNLSDWIQKDNFKVSDDRLDRFVKILEEILDKRIKITYELLENVKSSIDSGGEKSNIDRMVKNANYRYVADDEQIETIEDLIRSSSIDYHNVASKAYLWKAERDEKLPWAKIRKHYIASDKPMLRELGLRILNEILSNHPEMRDRIDVEEIIHLKDDNSKEIMIEASEKDPGRIGIYNYDPEKRFLHTLRHIGDNDSINLLIEYLKRDSGYNEEALTELHRAMIYDEVEKNYWKMLDEPMLEWFFDKEKLDDLSREKFRTFLHVVGFYWGPKAIVVYRNLLEKNEEESLKQAILNAIPETGKDWVEPVSDFLKDLILDENWNISSKAIDVFNELNESHYSKDHVILKAAKDDLDDLWTDIDTS